MKKLILIAGRPATGKTHIALEILKKQNKMILLSYDNIKEKNYDEIGFLNLCEKSKIDNISLKEFLFNVEKNMILDNDIISEYPFSYKQKEVLEKLSKEYGYKVYTIRLVCDKLELLKRIKIRDTSNDRHLAHIVSSYKKGMELKDKTKADCLFNQKSFDDICKNRKYDDFSLGQLLEIDTTNILNIDMESIYKFIKS